MSFSVLDYCVSVLHEKSVTFKYSFYHLYATGLLKNAKIASVQQLMLVLFEIYMRKLIIRIES